MYFFIIVIRVHVRIHTQKVQLSDAIRQQNISYIGYLIFNNCVCLYFTLNFLELPRLGDASCIAGKISDNGTLTLELRPCEQQLKVLCEGNNNDIKSSPEASTTVPVKRLTTAAKSSNSTLQSTNDFTNIEKGIVSAK